MLFTTFAGIGVYGLAPGVKELSALSLVIALAGAFVLADAHVRYGPTAGRSPTWRSPMAPARPIRPRGRKM